MTKNFLTYLSSELRELRNTGLYKSERIITSKQAGTVALDSGWEVINLCANNYLGLSDNAELIEAGRDKLIRTDSIHAFCTFQTPWPTIQLNSPTKHRTRA